MKSDFVLKTYVQLLRSSRRYMRSLKKKEYPLSPPITFNIGSHFKTWNETLHDFKICNQIGQCPNWSNGHKCNNGCGVKSVHNRGT